MSVWPEPFHAEGRFAKLIPLDFSHEEDLKEVCSDDDMHLLWYTAIPSPEEMHAEIKRRRSLSNMCPFAIINKATGKAVGMTSYMNIDADNKRVEIGSTWIGKPAQRTPINTECKLLLLGHAFEILDSIAVEFRTHFVNTQSRRAIERLGAKLDGILRAHMVMKNGTLRDTAVYSITASEWPTVQAHLSWQLEKPRC